MTESEQERRIYRKCEMAIGVTFMTLAIVLTVLVLTELSPINWLDVGWATWLGDHRREWIEDTALTLSQLGSGGVMWPVIGVTIVALAYTRRSEALAVFALTILSAQLFVGPLKALVARARPDDALIVTSGLSFPSGHSVTAAAFSFGLLVALMPLTRTRAVWYVVALAWMVAMAVSRTVVGAHWLSDTIGGLLYGCGAALFWSGVMGLVVLRRYATAQPPATRLPAVRQRAEESGDAVAAEDTGPASGVRELPSEGS